MLYKITGLSIILCISSSHALSEECYHSADADTPSKRFTNNAPGTVLDTKTDLTWARCSLGMRWSENSCQNVPDHMDWNDAHSTILRLNNQQEGYIGFSDWRLPTLEELATLIESKCYEPAINSEIFPNTPHTGFWTSTLDKYSRQGAWLVYFRNGSRYMGNKEYAWAVRPVRK